MEKMLSHKVSFSDTNGLIQDKLAPIEVELRYMTKRFDELRGAQKELNEKLDVLIKIVSKLGG